MSKKLFKREHYLAKIRGFYDATDIVKVITGVRRCGKSSLMQTVAQELCQKGVAADNIIFLDLDSLQYLQVRSPLALKEAIISASSASGMKYLFIDEIQNVENFEAVINAFRQEGNYSIFVTGSNSYLLSGELVTKLTGRYIEFEVYTLSFAEYLGMKRYFGKTVSPRLDEEFQRYILEGGFPRAVLFDDINDKRRYTQSVVEEILTKDITTRVNVRNLGVFETVRDYIFNNFGATTSLKAIQEELNKLGHNIKYETLVRYVKILEDAKVIYRCCRFDMKSKHSMVRDQKYYVSDLSFYFARNTDNRINWGPVLENIVYFYAKSMDYAVSVGRIARQYECDFIMRDVESRYAYVQVSYDTSSEKTRAREFRPFQYIRDSWPKYLLTMDRLFQSNDGVEHLDLVNFLAQERQF